MNVTVTLGSPTIWSGDSSVTFKQTKHTHCPPHTYSSKNIGGLGAHRHVGQEVHDLRLDIVRGIG